MGLAGLDLIQSDDSNRAGLGCPFGDNVFFSSFLYTSSFDTMVTSGPVRARTRRVKRTVSNGPSDQRGNTDRPMLISVPRPSPTNQATERACVWAHCVRERKHRGRCCRVVALRHPNLASNFSGTVLRSLRQPAATSARLLPTPETAPRPAG